MKACFLIAECRLTYAKSMPTSAMKACFLIAECRLTYAKIVSLPQSSKPVPLSFLVKRHIVLYNNLNFNELQKVIFHSAEDDLSEFKSRGLRTPFGSCCRMI